LASFSSCRSTFSNGDFLAFNGYRGYEDLSTKGFTGEACEIFLFGTAIAGEFNINAAYEEAFAQAKAEFPDATGLYGVRIQVTQKPFQRCITIKDAKPARRGE
ncbi:MAG: hypothetical protein KDK27_11445, partial [Leptospiraceae bacterium]|nr:hypothetical protein [Leptospiraceae bacterium]